MSRYYPQKLVMYANPDEVVLILLYPMQTRSLHISHH
nr:MAG TPA: Poxvirus trans-activator protein A1 C-terminal [Caudoviricetes sp.]